MEAGLPFGVIPVEQDDYRYVNDRLYGKSPVGKSVGGKDDGYDAGRYKGRQ